MTNPPRPVRVKASRPPHLPLADLETILGDVSEMLGRVPEAPGARALLEVETDALVLRRTLRFPEREIVVEGASRATRTRKERRRRDS